jgi:hypothetical protein
MMHKDEQLLEADNQVSCSEIVVLVYLFVNLCSHEEPEIWWACSKGAYGFLAFNSLYTQCLSQIL